MKKLIIKTSLTFTLFFSHLAAAETFKSELARARQGDMAAALNVCEMYRQGKGVNKNITSAQTWCRKAAASGNPQAQHTAAFIASGWYPEVANYQEAISWWKKAAMQGNDDAIYHLGWAYEGGKIVDRDLNEAAKWYRIGAKKGSIPSQHALGKLLLESDVDLLKQEGVEWLQKAAVGGSGPANYSLCFWLKKQDNKMRNPSKAVPYCEVAMRQGETKAFFHLGSLYAAGDGVPKDLSKAATLFQAAAERGNASAMLALGMQLEKGEGVKQDIDQAIELYKKAAQKGHPLAQQKLFEKNIKF